MDKFTLYEERGELLDNMAFLAISDLEIPMYMIEQRKELDEQIRLIEIITPEAQVEHFSELLPDGRTAWEEGCIREKFGKVKVTTSADWRNRQFGGSSAFPF